MTSWLIVTTLLTLMFLYWAFKFGPSEALAIVIPTSWLFPAWVMFPILDSSNSIVASGLDVKVAVTAICLALYCIVPGRTFPVKLVASDYAMLCLFLVHLSSDALNDEWRWTIPARAMAEWYLPYVAGRVSLQSFQVVRRLWKFWAVIAVIMALAAIFEGLSHTNPFELAFGTRPYEGAGFDHVRWGMRRAYGMTMNPIYLGAVQVVLSGWVAFAAIAALRRECHWIWVFAPAVVLLGIVCTGSRGPIFGTVFLMIGLTYYLASRLRPILWVGGAVSLIVGGMFAERLLSLMDQWTGEAKRARVVMIQGEEYMLTNARARLLLFEVHKIAFKRSGLLGFGTESVSGFPVNVPVGATEAETLRKIWTIENTYALLLLRFGYVGVAAFIAAAVLSLYQFKKIADYYPDTELQWFAAAVGASTFAALIVQASVWMPHEIGFPLVFFFGLSAGLAYADRSGQLTEDLSD